MFVETLLLFRLFRFCGVDLKMRHGMDSSAARGIVMRAGVGRIKHLEVKTLWWQDFARGRRDGEHVQIRAVATRDNGADIGTKAHAEERLRYLAKLVGIVRIDGTNLKEVKVKLYDGDWMKVGAVSAPGSSAGSLDQMVRRVVCAIAALSTITAQV